jgi:hypothetical protein
MSRCKLRTSSPIHFKLRTVIGIDSLYWFLTKCCFQLYKYCTNVPIHVYGAAVLWKWFFSFKIYGKESLYKYCVNVDDGRIMRSWRSCLLIYSYHVAMWICMLPYLLSFLLFFFVFQPRCSVLLCICFSHISRHVCVPIYIFILISIYIGTEKY